MRTFSIRNGKKNKYLYFFGSALRMESIFVVRTWLRSRNQSDHLQLHDKNQVKFILSRKISFFGHKLFNPSNTVIDWKLLLGASCFGLGWGIGGLCPGPAITQFSIFTLQIQVVWMGCLILGMYLAKWLDDHHSSKQHNHSSNPV